MFSKEDILDIIKGLQTYYPVTEDTQFEDLLYLTNDIEFIGLQNNSNVRIPFSLIINQPNN